MEKSSDLGKTILLLFVHYSTADILKIGMDSVRARGVRDRFRANLTLARYVYGAVVSTCQSTTSGAVGGLSACPSVTYDSCLLHALALVRIGISRANVIIRMASSIAVRLCLLCFKCLFPAVNFRRNFASHFFVVHGICQTPQAFRE